MVHDYSSVFTRLGTPILVFCCTSELVFSRSIVHAQQYKLQQTALRKAIYGNHISANVNRGDP
jgi:hypothetical protein